jgi:hypothetical protein
LRDATILFFNIPSSTGFDSFYLDLFFGKFGKNEIVESSNLLLELARRLV